MRSCLECHKFHYGDGERTYSDITVGYAAEMSCDATPSHWTLDLSGGAGHKEDEVRSMLLSADTCPDFISVEEVRGQAEAQRAALIAQRRALIIPTKKVLDIPSNL